MLLRLEDGNGLMANTTGSLSSFSSLLEIIVVFVFGERRLSAVVDGDGLTHFGRFLLFSSASTLLSGSVV